MGGDDSCYAANRSRARPNQAVFDVSASVTTAPRAQADSLVVLNPYY